MHEMSLMADLLRKVERIAKEQGGGRIARLTVRLGALSHFSPSHSLPPRRLPTARFTAIRRMKRIRGRFTI